MSVASLEVRSLWRSYGRDAAALSDVSFAVGDGRVCTLLGPAGSGKTTLLRVIAGLERADDGLHDALARSLCGPAPGRRARGARVRRAEPRAVEGCAHRAEVEAERAAFTRPK